MKYIYPLIFVCTAMMASPTPSLGYELTRQELEQRIETLTKELRDAETKASNCITMRAEELAKIAALEKLLASAEAKYLAEKEKKKPYLSGPIKTVVIFVTGLIIAAKIASATGHRW